MKLETAKDKTIITPIAMTQPIVDFIPDAEGLLAYQARVSNPSNQLNFDTADKLLKYCANHGHWSVFEMVNVVLEIKAPRDISRQILRHRSNAFQEFSQRYADVTSDMFCLRELRMQDETNRQSSTPCTDENMLLEWEVDTAYLIDVVQSLQNKWRSRNAAKECVRVFLPEGLTMSSMYVNFNVRSLMHYIDVRSGNGTQLEHQDVALKALEVVKPLFPNSFEYFGGKYE
jgi:thymidylate synthase (FAD)